MEEVREKEGGKYLISLLKPLGERFSIHTGICIHGMVKEKFFFFKNNSRAH